MLLLCELLRLTVSCTYEFTGLLSIRPGIHCVAFSIVDLMAALHKFVGDFTNSILATFPLSVINTSMIIVASFPLIDPRLQFLVASLICFNDKMP